MDYTSTAVRKYSYTKHSLFVPLLRCRQSTMPPHRLLPPPCTDTNIKHLVYEHLRNAVLGADILCKEFSNIQSNKALIFKKTTDTLYRCEELYEKKTKVRKREDER